MPDPSARPFDVILWGATGFTGRLVAEHLGRSAPTLRWALAGRNQSKLEGVRATIAASIPAVASVPILLADAGDPASLVALAAQGRVIASTVGPFYTHGRALVAACVEAGTDYCDSTGEPHFVRAMIDAHHDAAKAKGVRLVHCCGFDSIPSDLGTLLLADQAKRAGKTLAEVKLLVGPISGGASGGTIASMLAIIEEAARDPAVRAVLLDPYSLSPDRAHDLDTDGRDALGVHRDADLGVWTAPFVMAAINARIVRRSNALLGHAYGKQLRYSEQMRFKGNAKGLLQASLVAGGVVLGTAAAALPPARALLKRALPAQGEGPSAEARANGFFQVRLYGRAEGDARPSLLVRVEGHGDPGYAETAKMVGESALALALDPRQNGFEGGVLTTATAMGMPLVERLRRTGIIFASEPLP